MRRGWETYIARYPGAPDFARSFTRRDLEGKPMRFDPVECGKRMKALRESKNLTQMQLAEQLNISLNHVKALEHARRLFSIDLVIEISAFFDVSLDYLLLGKTQSTSKAASELNAAIEILERIKKEL